MNIVLFNSYLHINKRELATQLAFKMEVFNWPWTGECSLKQENIWTQEIIFWCVSQRKLQQNSIKDSSMKYKTEKQEENCRINYLLLFKCCLLSGCLQADQGDVVSFPHLWCMHCLRRNIEIYRNLTSSESAEFPNKIQFQELCRQTELLGVHRTRSTVTPTTPLLPENTSSIGKAVLTFY